MKFGYQFHLVLMTTIFCFGCAKPSQQIIETDAKTCQNNKVNNQYIVHWKKAKPTLNYILTPRKFIERNSKQLIFIEPNYRIRKEIIIAVNRNSYFEKNYFFRDLIHSAEAWKSGYYGQGVQIAIVDTGVDISHPYLRSHLMINKAEHLGSNNLDDDQNGFIDDIYGWNFISN